MKTAMFQVHVVRDRDNALTGGAVYRVVDCFSVNIDLADEYYNGRRVYTTAWREVGTQKTRYGCVCFVKHHQQKGSFISLRSALGIRKARAAA